MSSGKLLAPLKDSFSYAHGQHPLVDSIVCSFVLTGSLWLDAGQRKSCTAIRREYGIWCCPVDLVTKTQRHIEYEHILFHDYK